MFSATFLRAGFESILRLEYLRKARILSLSRAQNSSMVCRGAGPGLLQLQCGASRRFTGTQRFVANTLAYSCVQIFWFVRHESACCAKGLSLRGAGYTTADYRPRATGTPIRTASPPQARESLAPSWADNQHACSPCLCPRVVACSTTAFVLAWDCYPNILSPTHT
jgi:hypothetical protein